MREDQYGFDDLGEGVRDVRGLSKRADAACGEAYAVLGEYVAPALPSPSYIRGPCLQ